VSLPFPLSFISLGIRMKGILSAIARLGIGVDVEGNDGRGQGLTQIRRIQTWALEEARRRLEVEGILKEPESKP